MRKMFAILFSVLFFLPAAKGKGEVYGTVYIDGQVGVGVIVKVTINKRVLVKTKTNSNGEYKVYVEGGKTYSICFKAKGYALRTISNIEVPPVGSVQVVQKITKKKKRTKFVHAQFDRHNP